MFFFYSSCFFVSCVKVSLVPLKIAGFFFFFLSFVFLLLLLLLLFLGPLPRHMEVPKLGVESEL